MYPVTRNLALTFAAPGLAAPWVYFSTGNVGLAVAILIVPLAVAGAVLASRLYPVRVSSTEAPPTDELLSMLPVGGIIVGAMTASALVAASVHMVTSTRDASSLLAALAVAGLAVAALLLGFLAAVLVVLPLATLGVQTTNRIAGRRVDQMLVASSVLMLLVVVFCVAIALAVPTSDMHATKNGVLVALFVLVTVVLPTPDDVASVAALWVARAALLAIIGASIWVAAARPRRRSRK